MRKNITICTTKKLNYIEALLHLTAKNRVVNYNFDKEFYKYPSYLPRATIMEAIGICASHFSRLKNYEDERAAAKEKIDILPIDKSRGF